ncbi:diguanylate cyclase domain-containing protein [Alkalicoccus urumqiensis]|uniref:PAS domain S-box protein n=1 Tax=Alkalicoccus urumqiensis TaxID=1548213 RepID=A0A2P6MIR6_ALKUR|nr:diguanylate cyclase [Alkalicoccus urumqiensis]PRO66148.1 hypothetical protein C6I21_04930 [Alkalicoccus urumqiensis]
MKEQDYREIVCGLPVAYAYQKMLFHNGRAVDYLLLDVNEKMASMIGRKEDDIVGQRMQDVLDTGSQHYGWVKEYEKIIKKGIPASFERYSVPFRKWFRVQVTPHDEAAFSVVFVDVTKEKKQIESLDTFFTGNLGLLSRMDKRSRILEVNPEWTAVSGYEEHELIGRPMVTLLHPDDKKETLKKFLNVSQGRPVRSHVARLRTRSGSYRYIEWHAYENDGSIYTTSHDITDRWRKEYEIHRREALLENLTDQVPGGIYQLRIDAEETFSFPHYSAEFLEIFHVKEEEMLEDAMHIFDKIHPEDYEHTMASIFLSKKRGAIWKLEFRLELEGGHERWVRGRSKPTFFEDGSVVWHGHVADVTEEKRQEMLLKDSEERMRRLFSQVPGMLYQFDVHENGTYEFSVTSKGIWDLIEVTPWEAYYQVEKVFNRIHPDDKERVMTTVQACAEKELVWAEDYRVIHPVKGMRWVRGNANPKRIGKGTVRFYGYIYDITELREKEEALHAREELLSELTSRVPGMIYQLFSPAAGEYRFTAAAGGISDILESDVKAGEITEVDVMSLIYEEDRQHMLEAMEKSRHELSQFDEIFRITLPGSGRKKWVRATSTPERISGGTRWSGYLNDVDEQKQNEMALMESEQRYRELAEKMEEMAYHDPLTGLPNRRLLFDRLDQQMLQCQRTGKKLGLLFIDLDNFKRINDRHGHDTGDSLLVHVAAHLKQAVRRTDTVARMAGDEFLVVFTNLEEEAQLKAAVANLMNVFQSFTDADGSRIHVAASVGAVLYPDHGSNVEELLSRADKAMYNIKRREKNNFTIYEPGMEFSE